MRKKIYIHVAVTLLVSNFVWVSGVHALGSMLPKTPTPENPSPSPQPQPPAATAPTPAPVPAPESPSSTHTRPLWEGRHADGAKWTDFVINKLDLRGTMLTSVVTQDMNTFCPKFSKFSNRDRKYFWAYLMSAMVRFESNFKPSVTYQENFKDSDGDFVVSRGLLQLSYESAKGYQCEIRTPQDLHDPYVNLECGMRILDRWIGRDSKIAGQENGGWRGGARYWSVLRTTSGSYTKILDYMNQYKECRN
jgi:hypothetical protein